MTLSMRHLSIFAPIFLRCIPVQAQEPPEVLPFDLPLDLSAEGRALEGEGNARLLGVLEPETRVVRDFQIAAGADREAVTCPQGTTPSIVWIGNFSYVTCVTGEDGGSGSGVGDMLLVADDETLRRLAEALRASESPEGFAAQGFTLESGTLVLGIEETQ